MSMKNPLHELFVSVDIESDGPIPIQNSMLSLGAVAFRPTGLLDNWKFEDNLLPLKNAVQDPDTMAFWARNPEAWEYSTYNAQHPVLVMTSFNTWVENLSAEYKTKPIFAGFPASFDHMFVYVYSHYLLGRCAFKFSAWDAKTYATAVLKTSYADSVKKKFPQKWFPHKKKHTHKPLDDAIEQAQLFIAMMQQNLDYKE